MSQPAIPLAHIIDAYAAMMAVWDGIGYSEPVTFDQRHRCLQVACALKAWMDAQSVQVEMPCEEPEASA